MSEGAQRRREHVLRFWLEDRSLSFLLVVIVIDVFILGPLHQLDLVGRAALGVLFGFLLISGILVTARSRVLAIVFTVVALGSLVVHWVSILLPDPALHPADLFASMLACCLLAGIVFVQTNREGPITSRRIQGAVVVYLLVGIIFAYAYALVLVVDPTSFAFADPAPGASRPTAAFRALSYYSFVTLTTVGYGDIHAIHSVARALSVMEALIGQLFPAVMLARLVSMEMYYRQRRFEREQAALDRQALAHEVIRALHEEGKT